jgi:hypothetical protein
LSAGLIAAEGFHTLDVVIGLASQAPELPGGEHGDPLIGLSYRQPSRTA